MLTPYPTNSTHGVFGEERTMGRLRYAAIVGICALTAVELRATVILPATLGELTSASRAIVHGRVMAVEPRWVEGRQIETLVTIHANEYLKGDLGPEVTFKVPGGQMGPYRRVMVGAPTFQEGDEIVVFLNAHGPTVPWISGLNQGVFRVAENASGLKVVLSGVSLAAGQEAQIVRGDPSRQRLALQTFTDQVKALVREGRAR
jgi:hypothetical protein